MFIRGPLIIFPLSGQIQGEVVVGTTNGDNLGGSNYLRLLLYMGLIPSYVYDIYHRMRNYLFLFIGTTLYHIFHEIFSHHT